MTELNEASGERESLDHLPQEQREAVMLKREQLFAAATGKALANAPQTESTVAGEVVASSTIPKYRRESVESAALFHKGKIPLGKDGELLMRRIGAALLKVMPRDVALKFMLTNFSEQTPNEYVDLIDNPLKNYSVEAFLRETKVEGWKCPPLLGLSPETIGYLAKIAYENCAYHVPTQNDYVVVKTAQIRRHLVDAGVPADRIDDTLTLIEKEQGVKLVLPLFGRKAGIITLNGHRILVSRETSLMVAQPGDCSLMLAFLSEMLGEEQLTHFIGWLQKARRDFIAGRAAPAQTLIILGEVMSGKTLLRTLVVLILGGRYASAYQYLVGASGFNREIATAGVCGLDDELSEADSKTRSKLCEQLKSIGFSLSLPVTSKGKDSVTLDLITRVFIAGNDTAEILQSIPRKNSFVADKVMLLKASRVNGGTLDKLMAEGDPLTSLSAQLPAFADYIEHFDIPEDKKALRTGIASYWHPQLVAMMEAGDEDAAIIEMIEDHRRHLATKGSSATAILAALLKDDLKAKTILNNPNGMSFGKALGRIAIKRPDLVHKAGSIHNSTRWAVLPG